MTDLFTVSIDAVEGPTFRGKVHIINPDAASVPSVRTFPLALLVDAWHLLANGHLGNDGPQVHRGDRCPISKERGKEIVAGMPLKDDLSEIYDLILGKMVRVNSGGYILADDGRTVLQPERRAKDVYKLGWGSGRDPISSYVFTRSDPEELSRRAADIVTSYERGPVLNVPLWSEVAALESDHEPWEPGEDREAMLTWHDPVDLEYWRTWRLLRDRPFDEWPYAEITVTVSDAGYLEHLAGGGMRWSTAQTGYA